MQCFVAILMYIVIILISIIVSYFIIFLSNSFNYVCCLFRNTTCKTIKYFEIHIYRALQRIQPEQRLLTY